MNTRALGGLVLASGLVVSLAACAPAGGGESGDQELVIWDTGILGRTLESGEADMENSFIDQMAAEFEEQNPGLTVTVVQQGGDISSNGAQFQAASIAGDGPDIRIQYAGGPTISFAEFFEDLEPYLTPEIIDSMAGFNVNREDFDPEGAILGMPYGAGNLFTVFANNEMLEEAGLDPADPPTSWEELMANGEQIVENTDYNAFWMANLEGYVGAWIISALVGGELGESAFTQMYAGEIPVDDPAMVKAYEAFAELGASGLANPDAGQVSNGESTAGFVGGDGAYYIVGSWENNGMYEAFGDDVSVFFIPMFEDAEYPNMAAGGPEISISITNYSDQKELAGEFLQFLAEPENQDRFVELYQTQASNHSDADPSLIENPLLQQEFAQLQEATDGVVFAFDSVMPQATIDLFYRVNAGVFLGTITPEDAVRQLADSYATEIANQ
ncbi:ABC transporter substrate-binding protein [Microbacterium invictum]|uniref:Extracellular solute-binding protein n=1 Tax=Microbacterium invictum TaxID=515415 RepID=A0ABZ0VCP5_9MICO|nr:extracellular solute-binding protein [Microbacterium invictum]WQB69900.1 extracellular solute-binding protein [Microbacterium invictum]